jgi:hypothetical protein
MANPLDQFFGQNSGLGGGKGGIQIGDIANTVGGLGGSYWRDFGGLQPQVANIFQSILNGQAPDALLPMLSGIFGQIDSAKNTAGRNMNDKLSGGALAQGIMGNEENAAQQKAGAFQNLLSNLMGGAVDAGSNAMARATNPLLAVGGLRTQQKAANNAGGGGMS